MTSKSYDFVVAGAGIIGLATARALKRKYPGASVLVLEKEPRPGLHASGRNSGVLHSGIYYAPGTFKARLCVRGAQMMMSFAGERGIPFEKTGKVIVAAREEDLPVIDRLMANARANSVLAEKLSADDIRKIEPATEPYETGVYCPDTAVIDSARVVKELSEVIRSSGVEILFGERVLSADSGRGELTATGGEFSFGWFYNCAGAYADIIAARFGAGRGYELTPFKGIYFKLAPDKARLVRGNIYPVPDLDFPFLGVHFTRAIGGDVYAGPTAIPALGRENYAMIKDMNPAEAFGVARRMLSVYIADRDNFRRLVKGETRKYFKGGFLAAARRLMPSITAEDLIRSDKVGIRPQLVNVREKRLELDYVVERADRSTHVLNAISPAFTSSLAFAEFIVENDYNLHSEESAEEA
ncbi:MAG: L-2-hydroxyglutarate oxidase [Candidatus Nitrospinota bacterium M3_3B_026]